MKHHSTNVEVLCLLLQRKHTPHFCLEEHYLFLIGFFGEVPKVKLPGLSSITYNRSYANVWRRATSESQFSFCQKSADKPSNTK